MGAAVGAALLLLVACGGAVDVGLGPTSQAPPSPRFEGPYTLTFELSAACGDLAGLRYEWDLQGTQGESAALLTLPDGDPSELPTQR